MLDCVLLTEVVSNTNHVSIRRILQVAAFENAVADKSTETFWLKSYFTPKPAVGRVAFAEALAEALLNHL